MTTGTPLISILMVTHNRGQYIIEALNSIFAQTFREWELIIIDDASTDATKSIVTSFAQKDPRIRYTYRPEKHGVANARNYALQLAQGRYIAVLDSDDTWCDVHKLQKQYDHIQANAEAVLVLVGSNGFTIDAAGNRTGKYITPSSNNAIREALLLRNPFLHSSVLYDREKALSVGGYDTSIVVGEDYGLWLKLGTIGTMENMADPFVQYRIHTSNATYDNAFKSALDTHRLIKKYYRSYPHGILALVKSAGRLIYSPCIQVLAFYKKFRYK